MTTRPLSPDRIAEIRRQEFEVEQRWQEDLFLWLYLLAWLIVAVVLGAWRG